MVDRFNVCCGPSVAGQMPFCSQLITLLAKSTLYMFLSSCFLLPHLANEATILSYNRFSIPVSVEHNAYFYDMQLRITLYSADSMYRP
jgi:hypothetical protein